MGCGCGGESDLAMGAMGAMEGWDAQQEHLELEVWRTDGDERIVVECREWNHRNPRSC